MTGHLSSCRSWCDLCTLRTEKIYPSARIVMKSRAKKVTGPKIEIAIEEVSTLNLPKAEPTSLCLSAASSLTPEPDYTQVVGRASTYSPSIVRIHFIFPSYHRTKSIPCVKCPFLRPSHQFQFLILGVASLMRAGRLHGN